MPDIRQCSGCGTPLNDDAPEGFCPACMLEGALSLSPTHHSKSAARNSTRLDDYELLEEIARGGMGVVYRARQISLDRLVAVKLILMGKLADKAAVRRFKAEATAAARLRHPNIVGIYDIGEEAGQHFFSMDYVQGLSLADFMRQQPISFRQAAQLLKTIAETVQYAHGEGIVHRDLKPSNILIDGLLEPRITDFGLARDLKADSDLTLTGQVLGSPNYISPEQASGNSVGAPSDIYSLGAILYHLLSGRPPFTGQTLTETLHQVTTKEAVSPRLLNPGVPRDLETICLKCLEKEPGKRYSTAAALAQDLGRFLENAPIAARPVGKLERTVRWCRRKPAVATVLILLVILAVGSPLAALRINQERRRAEARAAALLAGYLQLGGKDEEFTPDIHEQFVEALKSRRDSDSLPPTLLLARGVSLRKLNRLAEAGEDIRMALRLPRRHPALPASLIDLSPFYTSTLNNALPQLVASDAEQQGSQSFGGIDFDVRGGVVRLAFSTGTSFPARVDGIAVHQKCRRLHFLHFVYFNEKDGVQVGTYVFHYADGETFEIPIKYGEDLSTWFGLGSRAHPTSANATIAWTGISVEGQPVRLFKTAWDNPRPASEIGTVDFISKMTASAPVLVALTLEP